ncbi:MAG: NADH-quinone oxidoreductase subunit NuoG [Deltaproteobacteria bacterium]|nr:NADH-quinone oxidoreductase subunit NuoG [Deltaproteobacteria bacterium]
MARIRVDGKWYEVKDGQNLLHACLSLGFDIPYFCWHPAMHSVGACRQCAVRQFQDERDTKGKIVMSCMTPAADGTLISIDDPEAREFRARVIEWLMVGHPHDCPVCDEGGECHLQDMTVMTGHAYRRYRFRKRTFRNQDLGPFVNHEMNRCIACYRCVRFYRDYAGGRDLQALGAHHYVYFGRHEDGTLENEFSGNLVEVCPTGVFTDKTLKIHYTRKWDLQTAPSVCMHCGLGCNTIPGERYGTLRRILNRYNGEVNGYFLCDRGRFGYEFVNGEHRIRQPLRAPGRGATPVAARREEAQDLLARLLSESGRVIGIGSPRASLEANFGLRTLVGPERFHAGMAEGESRLVRRIAGILRDGPAPAASIRDVEECDAVLVLGEDVTNTAPRLALALRQSARQAPMRIAERLKIPLWHDGAVRDAVQDDRGPFFIASPCGTKLDDLAVRTYRAAPDDLARLGFAVARELSADAPPVPDLSEEARALGAEIAAALSGARLPLVVSGTGCGSEPVILAAANIARALCESGLPARLCFTVPECNALGLALFEGRSLPEAFRAVEEGNADTVIVLENDLYRRADAAEVDAFLGKAKHVIVVDHLLHDTASKADLLLPGGTFAETNGTVVSGEGRAQRFHRVLSPNGEIRESWRWLHDALSSLGRPEGAEWKKVDDVAAALAEALPVFRRISECAPYAEFRIAGQKIPRQPQRYSGRTAILANLSVHEPRPPDDPDNALSFSMEGFPGIPPAPLVSRFWAPSWNSVQATIKFQAEGAAPWIGEESGIRLIEASTSGRAAWFEEIPPAFLPREGSFLVLPLHHIFGSEETSALSPAINQRAPAPYLALNPRDATALRIEPGGNAELVLGGAVRYLPVSLRPDLPRGTAGLPAGMGGWKGAVLPGFGTIKAAERP